MLMSSRLTKYLKAPFLACHRSCLTLGDLKGLQLDEIQIPTLGLDGIEERKFILVKALKGTVSQSRHRQGLQVQQFRWRWVLLW
jgi:hypothetical protein